MPQLDREEFDIHDQAKEVERELGMRRRVYPQWVARGTMKQDAMDRQMGAMYAALATLKRLAAETPKAGRLI